MKPATRNDPRDPKHGVLTRAGVIDAVKWIPSGAFYQARGGPLDRPFAMPDNFDAARRALTERFPEARTASINCSAKWSALRRQWARSRKAGPLQESARKYRRAAEADPALRDWRCRCRKSSTASSATTKPSNARLPPICLIITTTPPRCGGSISRWRREAIS
jgi:hypothetical protein